MSRQRKLIKVGLVAIGVSALVLAAYTLLAPAPPDLWQDGYTSATVSFPEVDHAWSAITVQADSEVTSDVIHCLADRRAVEACRCIPLATVTLRRADGGQFIFRVMPAHGNDDVQFDAGGRFRIDRQQFLTAVAPLGIPPERWVGD